MRNPIRLWRMILVGVAASGAVGCSGGHRGSDTCATPAPAGTLNFSLQGAGAVSDAGHAVGYRFLSGTTVHYCDTTMIAADGTFEFHGSASWPFLGDVRTELIISTSGTAVNTPGARHFSFDTTAGSGSTCGMTGTWDVPFDAQTAVVAPVGWAPGAGCPGT